MARWTPDRQGNDIAASVWLRESTAVFLLLVLARGCCTLAPGLVPLRSFCRTCPQAPARASSYIDRHQAGRRPSSRSRAPGPPLRILLSRSSLPRRPSCPSFRWPLARDAVVTGAKGRAPPCFRLRWRPPPLPSPPPATAAMQGLALPRLVSALPKPLSLLSNVNAPCRGRRDPGMPVYQYRAARQQGKSNVETERMSPKRSSGKQIINSAPKIKEDIGKETQLASTDEMPTTRTRRAGLSRKSGCINSFFATPLPPPVPCRRRNGMICSPTPTRTSGKLASIAHQEICRILFY